MIKRKFKTFETIAKFRKLYEAAEDEAAVTGDENANPEDATAPQEDGVMPESETDEDAASDPDKQADLNAGEFVSDNQKAVFAKMLLDALMADPPQPGTIPQQWLNATTDNADEIIKYIQGLNALEGPLSLENEHDPNSMAGALKQV